MTRYPIILTTCLLIFSLAHSARAADPAISIDTPMSPPAWALLERELLRTNTAALCFLQEKIVDLFNGVVALLVVPVDGALDLGNLFIAHVRAAGDVLFVPEKEVELVLLADGSE